MRPGSATPGLWYATSPDVKGLLVAEHTLEACLSEIVPTLERMALACSIDLVLFCCDAGLGFGGFAVLAAVLTGSRPCSTALISSGVP